jgi:uncharacterized protein YoxC
MWKTLLSFAQNVLTIAKDLDHFRHDLKDLEKQVFHLSLKVQELSDKNNLLAQDQQNDIEKLQLQLKVILMEFERRLPPTKER